MTVLTQIIGGTTKPSNGLDIRETINTLLPAGKFSAAPVGVRTSGSIATYLASTSPTAFAPIAALPASQIIVDTSDLYQTMYGFGGSLTESACYVLTQYCTPAQRKAILAQTFAADGFTTSRICILSSDFTPRPASGYYTYADDWDGVDTSLPTFTIKQDLEYIVPVLREALVINPRLKFIASPWTPLAKMKTTGTIYGGTPSFVGTATNYAAYATYFVKFLKAYRDLGIPVWAVTVQNEPMYVGTGYPGCYWSGAQLATFIGQYLSPTLQAAGLNGVRILTGDVNWNEAIVQGSDTISVPFADAQAGPVIAGAAWHGYDTATGYEPYDQVKHSAAGKEVHFTEFCNTSRAAWNAADMKEMFGNIAIGSIRAGAQTVTLWNLFLDTNGLPTPSTTNTKPVAAISTDGTATVTRLSGYAMLTHLARACKPGARRCGSTTFASGKGGTDVMSVAFHNPDGSVGVVLFNGSASTRVVSLVDARSALCSFVTIAGGEAQTITYSGLVEGSAQFATGTIAAPGPVTGLTATSGSGTGVLVWTAPSSTDPAGTAGYLIQRGTTTGQALRTIGSTGPGVTTFSDTDVVVGTRYFWVVTAIGAGGLSQGNPEANVTVVAGIPGAPTIAVAPGNAQNTVNLSQAAASNGSALTSYDLFRSTTSGGQGTTPYATNVTFPYVDPGTNGQAYFYTARGNNAVGAGTMSTEKSGTPSATLTKPGPGLLVSDDVGAGNPTAQNSIPTASWSNTSFTFSPSTSTVTAHNTVAGPDGSTLDGSTIRFNSPNASSGYASVECATSANTGAVALTGSVWLRGKVGGERIQIQMLGGSHSTLTTTQLTLTTSWVKYTITGTPAAAVRAILAVGAAPTMVADVSFDAAWANLVAA
ncbi:glycoside hydrolase family 30 beta sandwich domain-containing protein [Sphingomonas sp. TREG-RG-20F-R18-01]|uniref:glycoside hydrolase family 30 beta sandwich domain-containing protein n=1 Tax=Sphingomonas sp. TREG-RG-20F-R18-01 TaxID=2914982 RepID=UPI001F59AE5F|nr:glycoside hydrolase family 30 beta sandwich domain-containing protein [Sphingomonas sp. TREG-RG-20F-R18-01]